MLHWIILSQYTSICGAIHQTLYSHHREVETLTREDRDIMDGSTFFVVLIPHRAVDKQPNVAPDTELGTGYEKNISYYVDVIRGFIWLESDL